MKKEIGRTGGRGLLSFSRSKYARKTRVDVRVISGEPAFVEGNSRLLDYDRAIKLLQQLNEFYSAHDDGDIRSYNRRDFDEMVSLDKSQRSFGNHGFVYLMKAMNAYKIGKSVNAEERAISLQISLPVEIEIVHVLKSGDMSWVERVFHRAFEHKRIRGEWFDLSAEDVKKIVGLSEPGSKNLSVGNFTEFIKECQATAGANRV